MKKVAFSEEIFGRSQIKFITSIIQYYQIVN